MKSVPSISVVLPAYNAAATLFRAVDSIRAQTFRDWELIVVDDGSTDGTGEWLDSIARTEPRLRVLRRPHAGIVAALNAGLAAARGEFIARMDADDVSHPERLDEQSALFARRPELGLAGTLVEFGGCRERAAGYALHVDWLNRLVEPGEIALNRFVESPFAHPSVMFRRGLVEQWGGYREGGFPEDYELWLRWLDAGVETAKAPRVLLTWNDPPGRLSRNDPRYDADAFYRCKAFYLARWLKAHVPTGRRLLVWGAGRPTRKRAEYLAAHGVRIDGYVDVDPRKTGRSLGGRPVMATEELPAPEAVFVLGCVAVRGARELIRNHLCGRGFREGRDFMMTA